MDILDEFAEDLEVLKHTIEHISRKHDDLVATLGVHTLVWFRLLLAHMRTFKNNIRSGCDWIEQEELYFIQHFIWDAHWWVGSLGKAAYASEIHVPKPSHLLAIDYRLGGCTNSFGRKLAEMLEIRMVGVDWGGSHVDKLVVVDVSLREIFQLRSHISLILATLFLFCLLFFFFTFSHR